MIARRVLKRLLAAIGLWLFLTAGCFLYPSRISYAGVALLYLWYAYIPALFVVVSVAWFMAQQFARLRKRASSRV